ncbi:hypothetical protein HPB48_008750 [Haemaphysalis longicornis]|uniref:Uncharacterized protein n=1 Tax=Haemaphysalis longicornis TaxID=44386 RepID=A0A9J6G7Y9_HAELO|nr:hypothetical protein HPB48_008750 [Haemaphysalis longicornis]
MHRLALTPTGRKILQRLGRTVPFEHPYAQPVPAFLQAVIEAPPLPKNMQAGSQDGRRRARTRVPHPPPQDPFTCVVYGRLPI